MEVNELERLKEYKTVIEYISLREQNLERYTDKLRRAITHIAGKFTPQTISVGVDVLDDEPFFKDGDETYYLAIKSHYLKVWCVWDSTGEKGQVEWLENEPRLVLKSLIKSGRLLPFLNKVAKTLANAETEYEQVSEIAEKIANAIKD